MPEENSNQNKSHPYAEAVDKIWKRIKTDERDIFIESVDNIVRNDSKWIDVTVTFSVLVNP